MPTLTCRTTTADAGSRLDLLLNRWLPEALREPVSRSAVRRLVVAGAVSVNGRPVRRPGFVLEAGARVTVAVDVARIRAARPGVTPADEQGSIEVLFEDAALIAVAKPAGLLTHRAADVARADLFSTVQRQRPAIPLGLHHRLDRDTSGVVLFTKDPAANEPLARQFAGRQVLKVYHAIALAQGPVREEAWREGNRLALVGVGRRARMTPVSTGGEEAVTDFRLLRHEDHVCLVEAHPLTGRKHQIRAHLAGRGLPILGDVRYGGPSEVAGIAVGRMMLHALRLEFTHPFTGQPIVVGARYPADFAALLSRTVDRRRGRDRRAF